MLELIIQNLMDLRSAIITTGVGIILVGLTLYIIVSKFGFERKNLKAIGVFYEMQMSQTFLLDLALLRFLLVFSFIFSACNVKHVHIAYFGALIILGLVLKKGFRNNIIHLINGVVMEAILFVMSLLKGYLTNVFMDWKIAVILGLLLVILIMYSISEVINTINIILSKEVRFYKKKEAAIINEQE